MNIVEFANLAAHNAWHLADDNDGRTVAVHPYRGRMVIEWKSSRRRAPKVASVDFYDATGRLKATLTSPRSNVHDAIEHFMQGRGVTTQKAG